MIARYTIVTLCCMMSALPLHAGITETCLAVKIPLAERIASATAIVHGRVIAQHATWDDAHRSIYTINTVVVHDAWSTDAGVSDTISVVTEGGDMGAMGRTVIGALQLAVDDAGYLLLERPRRRDITLRKAGADGWFRPYAETQGLLVVRDGIVVDCWGTTGRSAEAFEAELPSGWQHRRHAPRPSESAARPAKSVDHVQGTITISPMRVIGGMGEPVTISGSGFGSERGDSYVTFTQDGTNYHSADYARTFKYRSWSDTEIVVEVPPSYSGTVRVVVGSTTHESADVLRVTSNLAARSINPLTFNTLINTNGSGGYTWAMDPELHDNAQARSCVESVMREFRCKTGMSFTVSPEPATAGYALNDGINAIVFDAPGYELGAGAVAYCDWIWYSCILGDQTFYWVRDTDCRLSRKFDWYYGEGPNPTFGMAKLRYVLFHEIGHAHQFGHVSELGESMHPVVQALPAEDWLARDTITTSEQRAGTFMTTLGRTFTFRACGVQPLIAPANDDCVATSVDGSEEIGVAEQLRLWPNPTSGIVTVEIDLEPGATAVVTVVDVLGEAVRSLKTTDQRTTIDVSDLPVGTYHINIVAAEMYRLVRVVVR
jgi:hypothetical protein